MLRRRLSLGHDVDTADDVVPLRLTRVRTETARKVVAATRPFPALLPPTHAGPRTRSCALKKRGFQPRSAYNLASVMCKLASARCLAKREGKFA